jgi:hypothetical protein
MAHAVSCTPISFTVHIQFAVLTTNTVDDPVPIQVIEHAL